MRIENNEGQLRILFTFLLTLGHVRLPEQVGNEHIILNKIYQTCIWRRLQSFVLRLPKSQTDQASCLTIENLDRLPW